MDIINENDMIREGRKSYVNAGHDSKVTSDTFNRKAIFLGIGSGLLMSLFLATSGFYITGDSAGMGFAKYLILAAAIGVILSQVKRRSPDGKTFRNGISIGLLLTLISALTTALLSVAANVFIDPSTIQPYFQQSAGDGLNNFTLAGITFFEGIVAGMILTFIWLQILKDRSVTADSQQESQ